MAANKKRPKSDTTPDPSSVDRRALRALFGTYWTAGGWRSAPGNADRTPLPPEAEVEYARAAGYMFGPRPMTHDQIIAWLLRSRTSVTRKEVTDAFLASLSTRRLDWRSALGSFAVARHFPDHTHPGGTARYCPTCGSTGGVADDQAGDLSILNFERFKWGGVRHLHPVYAALDLELFAKGDRPAPRAEDFTIMNSFLEAVGRMDADARLDHLQREVSKHLASSKPERRVLLEILGYCSILQHPDHPGLFDRFIPDRSRRTASSHGDWSYPVEHWRGGHGINKPALAFWFGAYKEIRR
jgi:hypothetical protein